MNFGAAPLFDGADDAEFFACAAIDGKLADANSMLTITNEAWKRMRM
jgi:hypothetical protein